jgi:hypothetical protein
METQKQGRVDLENARRVYEAARQRMIEKLGSGRVTLRATGRIFEAVVMMKK